MIHHYTTIENLKHILNNRKLRFTRIDNFDDIRESSSLCLNFNTYYFASCWTRSDYENVSLWDRYADGMRGVKISFSNCPFFLYDVKDLPEGLILNKPVKYPINQEDIVYTDKRGFKFMFSPYEETFKPFDINYVANSSAIITKAIKYSSDFSNFVIDDDVVAKTKNNEWRFQEEIRFIIKVIPLCSTNKNYTSWLPGRIIKEIPFELERLDILLDDHFYNNIEITLGPNCSEADKIIVRSLIESQTTNGKVKESTLKDTVRFK